MEPPPFVITTRIKEELRLLRRAAGWQPVDVRTPRKGQLEAQTVVIPAPWALRVTFAIEIGHRAGGMRRVRVSVDRPGRVPPTSAVGMIANELGFQGGLEGCTVAAEGTTVIVMQRL